MPANLVNLVDELLHGPLHSPLSIFGHSEIWKGTKESSRFARTGHHDSSAAESGGSEILISPRPWVTKTLWISEKLCVTALATKPAQEMAGSEVMKWREERWRRIDSIHSFSLEDIKWREGER